jgi:hypothetical protein
MNKTAIYTWALLLIFTTVSATLSRNSTIYIVSVIMILTALKFVGVAFQFMELKKAHFFWRFSIISFITAFVALILIIL